MSRFFSMTLVIILILLINFTYSNAGGIKITGDDGAGNDEFGKSLSVSGNYAIIGAPEHDGRGDNSGAAYILKYDGENWLHETEIISDDSITHDYFGYSVSVSGDYAIAGAFGADFGKGAAYIFKREGDNWIQDAKLIANDGSANDYFGYSVSVSGNYAAVGAYRNDEKGKDSGAVYIFYREGTGWIHQKKVTATDGAAGDLFGRAVSVFCDNINCHLIVGAVHDDDKGENSGSAYIFKQNGTAWIQQTKLTASDGAANDFFGFSVSVSGNGSDWYAIAGADSCSGNTEYSGGAYIFKLNGTNWIQQAKLTADDGEAYDFFGRSVSVTDYGAEWYAVVGADADDDNGKNSGSAYIFKNNGNNSWVQDSKLTADDGESEDNFGWAVSVSGEGENCYAMVGADADDDKGESSGSVYIYNIADNSGFVPDIDVNPGKLTIQAVQESVGSSLRLEPTSGVRSQESEEEKECAKGLVIPQDVINYWENYLAPPRRPISKNLPSSKDWSQYDSPVKSQKSCGSCWVFSAVALLENLMNQANLSVGKDLSEQTTLSCSSGDCGGGWYWDAFNYIYKNGIPPESCYAYTGSKGTCSNKCSNPDFTLKIESFTSSPGLWGEDHSVDDLREALQTGPLCVAMRVPDDGSFSGTGYTGGIYNYNGESIAWNSNAHAVLVVGYNDEQQYFKVKNSWGDWWGENGYFRISYDDVTDDVKFGSYACSVSGVFISGETSKFTITNTGAANLIINNITSDKSWLDFSPKTFPFTLSSYSQQSVTVSVKNWNEVALPEETGKISIMSNDPDEPAVIVEVTAKKGTSLTNPVLSVSPDFQEVSYNNGTLSIQVSNTGQGEITWTAEADDSWLSITEFHNSNGGEIIVNYEANSGVARTGRVTVLSSDAENSSESVEIRQEGKISDPGDIDNNGTVNLKDLILILKILVGIQEINEGVSLNTGDINGDNKIGLEEAVYALECASGIR